MSSLRHWPLTSDRFEHQFGVRALAGGESIVERTEQFDVETDLKRQLLSEDYANYVQQLPGSEPAQREAAATLITATGWSAEFDSGTDPSAPVALGISSQPNPLTAAALSIQEDVIVLSGDTATNHPIIAGVVCFPSGWGIAEKIGQPVSAVHAPVPEYANLMSRATNQLLSRLKPGRPVWRMNWGIRPSDRLDQSPKRMAQVTDAAHTLTAASVASRCFFRVERQTLSRLPNTGAILFTIHTHQSPLEALESWQKRNLRGVLQSCPAATLRYKGIAPFADLVCQYLERSQA